MAGGYFDPTQAFQSPAGSPSVADPLAGKDVLSELLGLFEQNRGMTPPSATQTARSRPGEIYNRFKPPGQMQLRFPWARPNRAN